MKTSKISRMCRNIDALCPACERFIGPENVCPYCGADSARNPVYKFLQWISLFFAVGGVIFLYLVSSGSGVPEVDAAGAGPSMNRAFVRMSGRVTGAPYIRYARGMVEYVSFGAADGTGNFRVCIYGRAARDAVEKGRLPSVNDVVNVSGALKIGADGAVKLVLPSTERMEVVR